jgi:hypothetical protein
MKLKSHLPEFCEEVRGLMLKLERSDLAVQLKDLEIVWRCPCSEFGCASFKVSGSNQPDAFEIEPRRRTAGVESADLHPVSGKIIVITDALGRIQAFEVRNRPDVRKRLFSRS